MSTGGTMGEHGEKAIEALEQMISEAQARRDLLPSTTNAWLIENSRGEGLVQAVYAVKALLSSPVPEEPGSGVGGGRDRLKEALVFLSRALDLHTVEWVHDNIREAQTLLSSLSAPVGDYVLVPREPEEMAEPSDEQLTSFGWAPGKYIIRCIDCYSRPLDPSRFAAKGAWRCREHAVVACRAAVPALPPRKEQQGRHSVIARILETEKAFVRDAALEEAAKVAEAVWKDASNERTDSASTSFQQNSYGPGCVAAAAAIRALKTAEGG